MLGFVSDSIRETIATIRKNKMRTALTGFAVAWGIFMLIVLLAAGNGMRNAAIINMSWMSENAVSLWGGWTSMPFKGFPTGRAIKLGEPEIEMLKRNFPEIQHISGRIQTTTNISYDNAEMSAWYGAVDPGYEVINNFTILQGRFLNDLDKKLRRKVVVIHPMHVEGLFAGKDPIGKYITINKINYQVIGVYTSPNRWDDDPDVWVPLAYAKDVFRNWWWNVEMTVSGINTQQDIDDFDKRIRKAMAGFKSFHPDDRSAFGLWNMASNTLEMRKMFVMISIFIIIIGVASLMAGLVGVGNIMLITVKERTREIGIRKSIGATRLSILNMIITEAVLITTAAGYIGIVLGVALTEVAGKYFTDSGESNQVFVDPSVDLGTVLIATLFLIACGVICGVLPALKATKVSPIEAMRAE